MTKMITITKKEYDELRSESAHLNVLESLGVDNWGGYVGPYVYCKECDGEGTWATAKCPDCGKDMPEPDDY